MLAVISGKFRMLGVITGKIRMLVVMTGEFRMLGVITGEFRKLALLSLDLSLDLLIYYWFDQWCVWKPWVTASLI